MAVKRLVHAMVFILVGVTLSTASLAQSEVRVLADADIGNLRQPESQRFVSGQPWPESFLAIKSAGILHVINLRPDEEMDGFDEAAAVESLGMQYHHLPVSGADDISFGNAEKLDAMLSEVGEQPVLLHCASGNRVGALMALRAAAAGADLGSALSEGRRWGLTRLEPVVRQRLLERREP